MGFISLNFSHLNDGHRDSNNCVFSLPPHGARRAHLEVSGCTLCCWLVAQQAAQSLPHCRQQTV